MNSLVLQGKNACWLACFLRVKYAKVRVFPLLATNCPKKTNNILDDILIHKNTSNENKLIERVINMTPRRKCKLSDFIFEFKMISKSVQLARNEVLMHDAWGLRFFAVGGSIRNHLHRVARHHGLRSKTLWLSNPAPATTQKPCKHWTYKAFCFCFRFWFVDI